MESLDLRLETKDYCISQVQAIEISTEETNEEDKTTQDE